MDRLASRADTLDRMLQAVLRKVVAWLGFEPRLSALLAVLTIATLLPPILGAIVWLHRSVEEGRREDETRLRDVARSIVLSVDRELMGLRETAEVAAAVPPLRSGDYANFHAWATRLVDRVGGQFILLDKEGQQLANTRRAYGGALPKFADWRTVARAVEQKATVSGDIVVGSTSGRYVVNTVVPVSDSNRLAALAFSYQLDRFQKIIAETPLPDGWFVAISDGKGRIAARSSRHQDFVGKFGSDQALAQMTTGAGMLATVDLEGRRSVTAYAVSPWSGWRAFAWAPAAVINAPAHEALAAGLAMLTAIILLSSATAVVASRLIRKPLSMSVAAASALSSDRTIDGAPTYMAETEFVRKSLSAASLAIDKRQRELAESEARLRHIANATPAMLWTATPDGRIWGSDRWYAYTGLSRSGNDRTWRDVIHPDDREMVLKRWRDALARGKTFTSECRIRGADGEYRWFNTHAITERDERGEVVSWYGSTTDVDALKKAERAIAASEERLRLGQEIAGLGTAEWDIAADRTTWSPIFTELFDLSRSGEYGTSGRRMLQRILYSMPPEDAERLTRQYTHAFENGGSFAEEFRIVSMTGDVFWRHVRAEMVTDTVGKPDRLIVVARDITRRKHAELEIARFAAFAEASSEAIIGCDLSGRIEGWNKAAERLFGWTADEVRGKDGSMVCLPESMDEASRIMASVAKGQAFGPAEVTRRHKDGHRLEINLKVAPVRDDSGAIVGVSASAHDISERLRREAHTRFVMRELSHRSKNLLAVVQAMARQTARMSAGIDDFQSRFAERVASLARSHDLLVKGDWEGAAMADLVASHLLPFVGREQARVRAAGPHIRLKPEAAQNIGMALHELATNAAKHGALSMPSGRIEIAWRIETPGDGSRRLVMQWKESGGPMVSEPTRRGFGRDVIERLAAAALDATASIAWRPEGIVWTLDAPVVWIIGESDEKEKDGYDFDMGTTSRELRGLYRTWSELKGSDRLPRFASLNPKALDGWPSLFIASADGPRTPRVTLQAIGPELSRRLGVDPLAPIDLADGRLTVLIGALYRCYSSANSTANPCYDWIIVPDDSRSGTSYETIIVPFSEDGITVSHLVGMAQYRGSVTDEGPRTRLPDSIDNAAS